MLQMYRNDGGLESVGIRAYIAAEASPRTCLLLEARKSCSPSRYESPIAVLLPSWQGEGRQLQFPPSWNERIQGGVQAISVECWLLRVAAPRAQQGCLKRWRVELVEPVDRDMLQGSEKVLRRLAGSFQLEDREIRASTYDAKFEGSTV